MGTAAVTTRMSVEEYLRTPFQPDVDFVDGAIERRNLGEWDHAGLQGILDRMLGAMEEEWGVFVSPELRVRITATRVRIPDVCVTDARNKTEQVPTKPPLRRRQGRCLLAPATTLGCPISASFAEVGRTISLRCRCLFSLRRNGVVGAGHNF